MGEIMSKRLDVMQWMIVLMVIILISRLGYLQVVQGSQYAKLSDGNRIRIIPIKAPRGIFSDRNGVPLVSKRPSFTVTIGTFSNPISDSVVIKLSEILNMKVEDIRAKLIDILDLLLSPFRYSLTSV